ncbi:MAG: F0F1 ATP synthase subunit B' [Ponticaulis sp.]|nr:F0F1 ATP synthase subunit B' [Ponticaulis sp.]
MASETHGPEHGDAAAHGAGGIAEAFPPFDASTFASQLFWLAIAFIVLYVVLSQVILPKVGGVIEERRSKIAKDLDDASRMKAEADEALVEMEKQLAVARADARTKADQARAAIDAKISETNAEKAAEIDARLGEAEERIQEMKAAHMARVAEITSSTTAAVLAQLGVTATDAQIEASSRKSVDEVTA